MNYLKINIKFLIAVVICAFALACGNTANSNSKTIKKPISDAPTIPANAPVGAQPPNTLGSPTAKVTIEEFADFQCPTCGNVYPIVKNVVSSYGSRIKFIYNEFPLPMHKNGYDAAVAAEAASQQGKFWEMENQLYTNQKLWADSSDARTIFEEYAGKIGLDVEKFKNDSLSAITKQRVDAGLERGRALGVNSTPTIYLNGRQLVLQQITSVDALRQAIDEELAKSGDQNQTAAPAPSVDAPQKPANSAPEKPSNTVSK